ncbi:outer membrane beta-barrel protein [Sungkyunkwania multivorans]|uniref:Outer membrane beta-barrel protein n=1 Tax=Sungkyunkwania multivorans TaxID=1173618 RepID=A0ABW3CZF1_9FLAO
MISGKVLDRNDQPISFSNVLVLKANDSTIVTGTTSEENGYYEINELDLGDYLLKGSFIGYEETIIPFKIHTAESIVQLDIALLETVDELDEVVVGTKRPTVERKIDRLVFNIANSTLSEQPIIDALKRTPGVLVLNDQITIKGDTDFQLFINDRKVSLPISDLYVLLAGTPASNVRSIEVITNPSARYGAEGGAIININMSKNIIAGYRGSLYGNFTQAVFPKYNAGISQFFKSKKLDLYVNYNYRDNKSNRNTDETINFFESGVPSSTWISDINRVSRSERHNGMMNLDYTFNSKSELSLSLNGSFTPERTYTNRGDTRIFNSAQLDSTYIATNDIGDQRNSISSNLGYRYAFSDRARISTDFQYSYSDFARDQSINTTFFDAMGANLRNEEFDSFSDQIVHIYSGQIDFESEIGDNAKLETGVKMATIESENKLDQNRASATIDDTFFYDEKNYAIYASYEDRWDKWRFKGGLRAEYSDIEGISEVLSQTTDQNYVQFFPNVNMQYTPSDKHQYSLSYGRRISRPRYGSINPFRYFLNFNSTFEGDPNLQPAYKNLLTLSYTLNGDYTFELYYRYEENSERQLIFQNNTDLTLRYVNSNIDREVSWGFDFTTYKSITDHWSLYVLNSIYYSAERFRAIENNGQLIDNGLWSLFTYVGNELTLSKKHDLQADINLTYVSPAILGASRQGGWANLSIGLRKTTADRKWSFSLISEDLLGTSNPRNRINYLDQSTTYRQIYETRFIRLGARYRFGNRKLEQNSSTKKTEEQKRLEEK